MRKSGEHLPVYGVGPYYGIAIILLTAAGGALSAAGILSSGEITNGTLEILLKVCGTALFVGGFLLWKAAAIGKNCIDSYIKSNQLCRTGVYGIVRNPCYSGIMFMCSGVIFAFHNVWLFPLPFLFWAGMTVLMKATEEKWLAEQYGQAYLTYCRQVNRCIPWFPSKGSHTE